MRVFRDRTPRSARQETRIPYMVGSALRTRRRPNVRGEYGSKSVGIRRSRVLARGGAGWEEDDHGGRGPRMRGKVSRPRGGP